MHARSIFEGQSRCAAVSGVDVTFRSEVVGPLSSEDGGRLRRAHVPRLIGRATGGLRGVGGCWCGEDARLSGVPFIKPRAPTVRTKPLLKTTLDTLAKGC